VDFYIHHIRQESQATVYVFWLCQLDLILMLTFYIVWATAGLSAHTPASLKQGPVSAAIPVAKKKHLMVSKKMFFYMIPINCSKLRRLLPKNHFLELEDITSLIGVL